MEICCLITYMDWLEYLFVFLFFLPLSQEFNPHLKFDVWNLFFCGYIFKELVSSDKRQKEQLLFKVITMITFEAF